MRNYRININNGMTTFVVTAKNMVEVERTYCSAIKNHYYNNNMPITNIAVQVTKSNNVVKGVKALLELLDFYWYADKSEQDHWDALLNFYEV